MHISVDPDEAWERLRASRWAPPGRASSGSRRKTYTAALEQTEQMFRAAAVVGPATRPLQVFYGLSQAGRAIAAAAWSLKGEDWRLVAHGQDQPAVRRPGQRHPGQGSSKPGDVDPALVEPTVEGSVTAAVLRGERKIDQRPDGPVSTQQRVAQLEQCIPACGQTRVQLHPEA